MTIQITTPKQNIADLCSAINKAKVGNKADWTNIKWSTQRIIGWTTINLELDEYVELNSAKDEYKS